MAPVWALAGPARFPGIPCGMPNAKTAALDVPVFVTVADAVELRVVTVPTVIVAAEPVGPRDDALTICAYRASLAA